jgi:hypothetical protein
MNARLIHKVSFPGAVYRNKTQLRGNIYCNRYSKCSDFFQHIRHRNWDICHTVGPTSVFCAVEVCRLGLEPLCSGVGCLGTHRAHNFLNNRCSVPSSCKKEREICEKWLLSSVIVKLCSVHSETFITDRTSQSAGAGIRASTFNSCNAAIVRTQEVPLVHAPCYSIALSRMCSRFAQYKVC